jgi:choline dehydrogenase-like flavoprotein
VRVLGYRDLAAGADARGHVLVEADVAVVGSGAGGAVAARELSATGRRVVVLEEGPFVPTESFTGRPMDMVRRTYRYAGMTSTLGRPGIPLPLGRAVGGTTVINSGTCLRAPDAVLARWRDDFGLRALGPGALDPYFEEVERTVGVAPVPYDLWGRNQQLFARGAEKLGFRPKGLPRNARGCRGTGLCAFGCPRGAKQSMLRTYLPWAAAQGAVLYSDLRAERLLVEWGAAAGVHATARDPQGERPPVPVTVRARRVVLAGGAIGTPALMEKSGLGGAGPVGRGLRIHPASKVYAYFENEDVRGLEGVPQGVYLDEWAADGIVFEGIFVPPELGALAIPGMGAAHKQVLARYRNVASFGVFVSDTAAGRVRLGPEGVPLMFYDLAPGDARKFLRGLALLCEAFLAAGAKEVYPGVHGVETVRTPAEARALVDARAGRQDLELMAFHPMGTCRMGRDRRAGVVDTDGAVHAVPGLWVMDASVFPTSLGVNPQETIMAFATRAARRLAQQL